MKRSFFLTEKIKKIHLDPKTKQSHLPWKIHEINATVTPKRRLFNCLKQRVQDVCFRKNIIIGNSLFVYEKNRETVRTEVSAIR